MAKWPYNTSRWHRLRLLKLRQNPFCEYCPGLRKNPATDVDHRQSIANGGAVWDMENLVSACHPCHSQKTARGEVIHGCDTNGFPIDKTRWQ